jgi:geranylgeranyl diphosphate synthase type I
MAVTTGSVLSDTAAWGVLDETRQVLGLGLRAAVDRLAEPTRTVAGYHFGWWDEHGHPTDGGMGKAVRPALVRLCADAVGSSAAQVADAAVAVELAHNFTLLHDDVMDGDELRRHRRTVWSVFGVPTAILTGDALLVLAIEVLSAGSAPRASMAVRWLCDAMQKVVAGQAADMSFERRHDVSVEECVAMAADKTAALLGCACAIGAVVGGAEPARVEQLRRFGYHLGLAFQLIDDLLGIWGEPNTTGKPRCSDLRAGKKSLPVVAALSGTISTDTEASCQLARLYLRAEPLSETELVLAASLIERAGGRDWARDEADRHLTTALTCLQAADPVPEAAAQLAALARLITRRDR